MASGKGVDLNNSALISRNRVGFGCRLRMRIPRRLPSTRTTERMMDISDLHSLVEQRRSIRGYDQNRDVPDEVITAILECARWAPSGGNGQPRGVIVIRDKGNRPQNASYFHT